MNEIEAINKAKYEIEALIENTYRKIIYIPDVVESPYSISLVELNNQQYYFEYYWNSRSELLYLSIYKLIDGKIDYYLKNCCLINKINISKFIYRDDWSGSLYFYNISPTKIYTNYRQDTISQDFYIEYVDDRG